MLLQKNYKTFLTEELENTSTGEIEIKLGVESSSDIGYLIVEPGVNTKEESIFFHRKVGTSVFAYGVNRDNPVFHNINSQVFLASSIDVFNHYSKFIGEQGHIFKKSTSDVIIKGGTYYLNNINITINDLDTSLGLTNKSLVSNAINYIHIKDGDYYISTIEDTSYLLATITVNAGGTITDISKKNIYGIGTKGDPGTNGTNGIDGIDGREVGIQKTATHIQWRYEGDITWNDLVLLTELKGDQGVSISSVELISTVGNDKTYRINFTDTTYFDYVVTDGTNGTNGINGVDGNGIDNITLISTVGKVKTYRITYTDATIFDYTVTDGTDGLGIGDLLSTNNLSDLDNIPTARDNLDVYSTTETDNLLDDKLNKNITLLDSINLNTITDNGFYCANATCTNLPESGVKTRLRVNQDPSNSDLAMQEALTTTTLVSYVRITENGGTTWTAWARIKATDETKANKTNVLELDNVTAFTPDNDYEPATKKYVDDKEAVAQNLTKSGLIAGEDMYSGQLYRKGIIGLGEDINKYYIAKSDDTQYIGYIGIVMNDVIENGEFIGIFNGIINSNNFIGIEYNTYYNISQTAYNTYFTTLEQGQTFTIGNNNIYIDNIKLYSDGNPDRTYKIVIRDTLGGTILGESNNVQLTVLGEVTFNFTGITLIANTQYYFEIIWVSGVTTGTNFRYANTNVYSGGNAYDNGVSVETYDLWFKINGRNILYTNIGSPLYMQDDGYIGCLYGTNKVLIGYILSSNELMLLTNNVNVISHFQSGGGTITFRHGLGRIPKIIKLDGYFMYDSDQEYSCSGYWSNGEQKCATVSNPSGNTNATLQNGVIAHFGSQTYTVGNQAVVTEVTENDFNITFYTGSNPRNSSYIIMIF